MTFSAVIIFVIIKRSTAENNSSTFFFTFTKLRSMNNCTTEFHLDIFLYRHAEATLISHLLVFFFSKKNKNLPNYLITTCNFFSIKILKIFLQFIRRSVYENL